MRRRTLATHFVETPALLVAVVAELLHETSSVEVSATRTVVVNQAIVCELWTTMVECRQFAEDANSSTTPRRLYGFGGHPGMFTTGLSVMI